MNNLFNATLESVFIMFGRALAMMFGTAFAMLLTSTSFAEDYSITLKGNASEAIKIGVLTTKTSAQETDKKGLDYKIRWETEEFEDHFLSMRPFKCLPASEKLWCYTPYPYEIKRHLTEGDITDLEYDLIFVWKPKGEYGINLWNGVYYKLEPTGFGWKGTMQEYDLNVLGIPPEAGELRPILEKDLHEASTEDHFLPFVEIRKISRESLLNQ